MSCPDCLSTSLFKRKHRTSLGYRTFCCRDCNRRFNESMFLRTFEEESSLIGGRL